ncbi:Membrane metallo-endopeptidase-like 1 [Nymphon striatum]|nr:Membrane metallo-endopeptidase-like 1 [Nymphon striatum]
MCSANEILSSMNLSADPCHDFYNFVCGKWSQKYPIREVDLASSTFINIKNQVTENIKDILESAEKGEISHRIMKDVLKFYRRCQDEDLMEKNGKEPLIEVLKNTIGGWPVADDGWTEIDQPKTYSFGLDWGTLMKILATGQTGIRLEKYKKYISVNVDIVSDEMIYDRDEEAVIEEIDEIVEFERLLARTIAPPGTRRNVWLLLNETKVGVFQKNFTNVIRPDDNMYPIGLPYLKKLDEILSTTPARTLANFLGWVIVRSFGPMTVKAFRSAELRFLTATEGIGKKSPRRWSCISTIKEQLPFSIVGEYVKRYVSPQMKTGIEKMIVQVRNSVLDGLDLLTWMDKKTKQEAINKVESIVDFVAYPEWVLNDEEMENRHRDILSELRKSQSFLEDIVKTRTYQFNLKTLQLKQKPDRKIALNYGSMGSVIGHEIIHGLDDRGSNFDNVGILRNWWQNETMGNYKKNAKCFQNQYEEIVDPGTNLKLNGLNTLGENIADNGGVRQAYRAYETVTRDKPKERLGLLEKFTDKQLFFLSYAHTFCEDFRQPYAISRILQETHSLNAYSDVIDAARDVMDAVRDVIPVACEAFTSKMLLLLWLRSIPCFNATAATREALSECTAEELQKIF